MRRPSATHRKQVTHWELEGHYVHGNGRFLGQGVDFARSVHKSGPNHGQEGGRQKRDTLERMSQYLALSREGRLKNRGRPWPREWS